MNYTNFDIALYCPVGNLLEIGDLDAFGKKFDWITRHIKVGKVYLETFRGGVMIDREKMLSIKKFFNDRGIKTSGGITTETDRQGEGFAVFCYTQEAYRKKLQSIVEITASIFDEVIFDDFYFTNCKCDACIKAKGDRSWSQYRLALKKEVSSEYVLRPAKKVNPNVNMIIKFPNWYEHYQECGYNLADESEIFDSIYTGTETRNPQYTQQHLPKYLSYFIMRYLEHVKPGKNLGGWFDPYECNYSLTSYAEQAYLTLFGKAKETSVFCLGAILRPENSLCAPVLGQLYADMDPLYAQLGTPVGTACYLPYHSKGEDYLHNYLGMAGIPLEPYPQYPETAKNIFLTAGAAEDPAIIDKVMASLAAGADVIVTSGFVERTQDSGFDRLTSVRLTNRKAQVNRYAYSFDGGVCFGGCAESAEKITISQIEYPTNDTWELVGAFGEENSFPILLKTAVGKGRLFILTIPDDFGHLYELPREVLKVIREAFGSESPVSLDAKSKVTLYTYDNDTFIVRSFLPYIEACDIAVKRPDVKLLDLVSGKVIEGVTTGGTTIFKKILMPSVNCFYRIVS